MREPTEDTPATPRVLERGIMLLPAANMLFFKTMTVASADQRWRPSMSEGNLILYGKSMHLQPRHQTTNCLPALRPIRSREPRRTRFWRLVAPTKGARKESQTMPDRALRAPTRRPAALTGAHGSRGQVRWSMPARAPNSAPVAPGSAHDRRAAKQCPWEHATARPRAAGGGDTN